MGKKSEIEMIEWDSPEYVVEKRGAVWYIVVAVLAVGVGALSVWLQLWSVLALTVITVVLLIVRGEVKPRKVHYKLDDTALFEGSKVYPVADFGAFGVRKHGDNYFLILRPNRRFGLRIDIIIPDEQGEKIVDFFGARVPMEESHEDFLDKMVRLLKI
jgi:hypothetical protein